MKVWRRIRTKQREAGIALLISIFILLLISVVAIALIVSSSTETALAGNYRSSTGVYYAAMAGLEEARSRLLSNNPSSFRTTSPGFLPSPGTPLAVGVPVYVINPLPSETVAPWDPASTYPDKQFNQEFQPSSGFSLPNPSPSTNSIWITGALASLPFPGPLYKWVRINAIAETSLGIQVAPYDGHTADPTKPIFYNGTLNVSGSGAQVLELTAFAALTNGSQKLVQYLVAPTPVGLPPLPAALTLAGSVATSVVSYTAPPTNNGFIVDGGDHDCTGNPVGGPNFPAIGVFNSADAGPGGPVISGIPAGVIRNNDYPGTVSSPDVEVIYLAFTPTQRKPSGLDAVMQSIIQNADVILTGPADATDLTTATAGMASTSPMTVVVNGDLDLTGWHRTGYGLLLVTGNLNYDPDASWDGIVLVVGQGTVTGSRGGAGGFLGALLVARTRTPSGILLLPDTNLGTSSVNFNFNPGSPMGGVGIRYSSCWIQQAQPLSGSKILSFHEISQ